MVTWVCCCLRNRYSKARKFGRCNDVSSTSFISTHCICCLPNTAYPSLKATMPSSAVLASPQGFLKLPRELRDAVYEHYVAHSDGYRYNPETGKLQTSDGSIIEASFMYTCKQIAAEMKGLGLRYNTIAFTATLQRNPNTVERATRFHTIMEIINQTRLSLLDHCRSLITPEIESNIESSFADCGSFLQLPRTRFRHRCQEQMEISKLWGMVPSQHRDLVTQVLQQIEKTGAFPGSGLPPDSYLSPLFRIQGLRNLSDIVHEPWKVPTEVELNQMEQACPTVRRMKTDMRPKRCFSAAALAVHFLKSLPESMQSTVTKVCLHEVNIAAAFPECHAKALIPFCVQNPKLRIERHVNLWQYSLPGFFSNIGAMSPVFTLDGLVPTRCFMLRSGITRHVANWIEEALALHAAGMPANSFSLIFSGRPDHVRSVVDVVKEDATWQAALEECVRRKSVALPAPGPDNFFAGFRGYAIHILDAFPKKMAHVLAGKSFIRFSGVTEELPCVEDTIRDNRDCVTYKDWDRKWKLTMPTSIDSIVNILPRTNYAPFGGYYNCL